MSVEDVRREIEEKLRRRLREELEKRGVHDEEACAWLKDKEALEKVRKAFELAAILGREVGFPLCGHDKKPGEFVIGEESMLIKEEKCPAGVPMTGFFHVHVEPVEEFWLNEYFSTEDFLYVFLRGEKGYTDCLGYRKGGKMYVKCYAFPGKDEILHSEIPQLLGKIYNIVEKGRGLVVGEQAQKYEELMRKVEEKLHVCVVEIE